MASKDTSEVNGETGRQRRPRPASAHLPGDLSGEDLVARMLRVDQAGEYGARRIYEGQLAALGPNHPKAKTIRHMYEQELEHLKTFDGLVAERQVRPTALQPLWHVAGFALGAATGHDGGKGRHGLHRRGGGGHRRALR